MNIYTPAEGSSQRAAWDQLDDDGKALCDAWINGTISGAQIQAVVGNPVAMHALGYGNGHIVGRTA
ncbi:MAG: hypothetical protein OXT70_01115 [Chloroflexota bacterium]|nr:hypothetical protein [Chloroflexota bacterium]